MLVPMAVIEAQIPLLERLLEDRYVVNHLVASTAATSVYAGRRVANGFPVAVKAGSLDLLRRVGLLAEARWARLCHPHVARIYEFIDFPAHNLHCCILDLLDGETLDLFLYNRQPALTVGNLLTLLRAAAEGIDALHGARILHLDIKPTNIVAGPTPWDLWIADNGLPLAIEATSTAAAGAVPATAAYMAPERVIGTRFGPRSDIYSFAATIYEILTHRPLHDLDGEREIAFAQVHDTPVCLRRRNPRVPALVSDAVHRSLEKNPELRHGSARELVNEIALGMFSREADPLDSILDGTPSPIAAGR